MVVVRPALMAQQLGAGERVTVSFPAEKSFVFSYLEKVEKGAGS